MKHGLFLIFFSILGCETFHGISLRQSSFYQMTPELVNCIQKAIQADDKINFVKYERLNNNLKTSSGYDIFRINDYFIYQLKSMPLSKYGYQIYVAESRSDDKEHNGIEYSHSFGSLNQGYTDSEKKLARETISSVEGLIGKRCNISFSFK